ncbi:MAG TPA: helix-turn-helix transcriptional regulator [Vicinamibacterales bacterium]|nr:helix-turn-helix transcriptional regulator [Vicinamibacterales bacterium]
MRASPFGALLRSCRERRSLTLSRVARALRISVVYYRDVELGRRRPFSALKVDFEVLASILDADPEVLLSLAANERGQLELDFKSAGVDERRLALLFARSIGKKKLARAGIRDLTALLRKLS